MRIVNNKNTNESCVILNEDEVCLVISDTDGCEIVANSIDDAFNLNEVSNKTIACVVYNMLENHPEIMMQAIAAFCDDVLKAKCVNITEFNDV